MRKQIYVVGLSIILAIVLSGMVSASNYEINLTGVNNGITDDAYTSVSNPATNYGSEVNFGIGAYDLGDYRLDGFIKINLSSIPSNAINIKAYLTLEYVGNFMDAGETISIGYHHVYSNYSWSESTINYNNRPTTNAYLNLTAFKQATYDNSFNQSIQYNITLVTLKEILISSNNLTIGILPYAMGGTLSKYDTIGLLSKEYALDTYRPFATINYFINESPTLSLDLNNTYPNIVQPHQNIKFNITCSQIKIDFSTTMIAYLQIYNGTTEYLGIQSQVVANNTKTTIYTLSSALTTGGETWTGEYWCGDGYSNSTKDNNSAIVNDTTRITITSIYDYKSNLITGQFNITNVNTSFSIEGILPLLINSTAGSNVLTLNKIGWFEINHTVNNIVQDQTIIISNLTMYNSKFEVFVVNSEDNSSIEEFNLTIISNDNTSFTQTFNFVNSSINFNLTNGSYNLTTSSPGKGTSFKTINVSNGTTNTTIVLFPRNTINFTIIDLTNLTILDHQNVDIQLVGITRTYNINTSTGNVVITDINDDTYIVTASSSSFDDTSIIVTTSDSSPQQVTIYMDKGKTSKLFFTIDTSTNSPVPDTILTFTRNVNGTFVTTTQVVTDFSGAAIVLLNENITYTFTAINPLYNVFTGDVNPATSTTFTIDMTLAGGLSYESFLNFLLYNTIVTNNGTQINISLSTFAQTTPGIIEWFSINATYNGTSYFTNVTGSPGGGTVIVTIPGVTPSQADTVSVIYGIKANSYPSWKWNEISLIILLNATNTTIMTGLFDISDDDITINGRAIIGIFFVVLVLGGLTAASRSITIGAVGGIVTLGVMIMPQVALLPVQYGSVSIIVLIILMIGERATGGSA